MIPIDKASANFRVVKATVFKFGSQQNHNTGTPAASVTCPFETKLVLPSLTLRVSIRPKVPSPLSSRELSLRLSENTSPVVAARLLRLPKVFILVTLTFSVAAFFIFNLLYVNFAHIFVKHLLDI